MFSVYLLSPQWKHYYVNKFGEIYSRTWDSPVAKLDFYYVDNLLYSRGIKKGIIGLYGLL